MRYNSSQDFTLQKSKVRSLIIISVTSLPFVLLSSLTQSQNLSFVRHILRKSEYILSLSCLYVGIGYSDICFSFLHYRLFHRIHSLCLKRTNIYSEAAMFECNGDRYNWVQVPNRVEALSQTTQRSHLYELCTKTVRAEHNIQMHSNLPKPVHLLVDLIS